MNHLYRLGNVTRQEQEDLEYESLWVCADSPYKLCRKCPLYHGIKAAHSDEIKAALGRVIRSKYSLYVGFSGTIDMATIPSKRCRWSHWFNMRPVVEVKEPQTEGD